MSLASESRQALDERAGEGLSIFSESFARLWSGIDVQAASAKDLRLR